MLDAVRIRTTTLVDYVYSREFVMQNSKSNNSPKQLRKYLLTSHGIGVQNNIFSNIVCLLDPVLELV